MKAVRISMLIAVVLCGVGKARAEDAMGVQAAAVMAKAATFYRGEVASHGGYVYYYSEDLARQWGEGEATRDQVWVQPPGTPTVGMAYLDAHAATGGPFYLEAAVEAAEALFYGQLKSGGWTNSVDFDPKGQRVANYRNGKGRGKNFSTLDDGISQAAIRFLMRLDRVLKFENKAIHEAVEVALEALLAAQFPNGGFPQGWEGPVAAQAVVKARYPEYDWRSEGRIKNYWDLYTLNDGAAGTIAETLIDAHAIYGEARFEAALAKLGEFLVLAQMPEPQPAWAQQYSYAMIPVWARKFEPPAIAGRESQDVVQTLMAIYRATGDRKVLEPIPGALAYLKRSVLPGGELARYYELKTNTPLYMEREGSGYRLTYDDGNLPDHYGWKGESRLAEIEREYRSLQGGLAPEDRAASGGERERRVRAIVEALDAGGRWVSVYGRERLVGQPKFKPGERYISSAVFSENLGVLAGYVARK